MDIIDRRVLEIGMGQIQSLTYLASLRKLYETELTTMAASGFSPQSTFLGTSAVFEVVPPSLKVPVTRLAGANVVKMVAYPASNGKEYILLIDRSEGRIHRLVPTSGQSKLVVSGLNEPTTAVLDPASGNLLVAEADQIRTIETSEIEAGLETSAGNELEAVRLQTAGGSLVVSASGLAADECEGAIYLSDREAGEIRAWDR